MAPATATEFYRLASWTAVKEEVDVAHTVPFGHSVTPSPRLLTASGADGVAFLSLPATKAPRPV